MSSGIHYKTGQERRMSKDSGEKRNTLPAQFYFYKTSDKAQNNSLKISHANLTKLIQPYHPLAENIFMNQTRADKC
jgi:hypothetical protein